MLSPRVLKIIAELADEMSGLFTPPELIAGCEVLAIDDKDQYASDNGWIEARVGQHNRQRCRWRGQFYNVQVGDFVDVLFFASYRLFVVFGQGGTGAAAGPLGHDLLSANHTDTLAASPVAGDIITANATPAWARLAAGQVGQYVTPNASGILEWRDIPTVGITEFLYDVASDIATYFQMKTDLPTGGDQTFVSTVSASNTLLAALATNANQPGVDFINDGVWHLHIHAQKTGPGTKDIQLKFQVYSRTDPGGVETQIGTGYSESTANLTTSEAEYDLHLALDEVAIALTDRIVLKIYADSSGSGSNPDVTITVEGDTDARLEIPAIVANPGSGGWPFDNERTVDPTNANASDSTIADAITNASTNDILNAAVNSWAETLTLNKNVTLRGRSESRTFITRPLTLNTLSAELEDLWVFVSSTGTAAIITSAAVTLTRVRASHQTVTDARGLSHSTATLTLRSVTLTSNGTSTSRALEVTGGLVLVDAVCDFNAIGAGTNYDVYCSGGTVRLNGPILRNGTIFSTGGTVTGWYRDGNGKIYYIDTTVSATAIVISGPAGEGATGVAELATQAETDAGTDDTRIVTPLKLGLAATVQPKIGKNLLYSSMTHNLWQEGTTLNDIADDTYGPDSVWLVLNKDNAPDVAGVAGGSTDPFTTQFRCTFDSASAQAGIVQFLEFEDTYPYRGQVVSLSADLWGTNVTSLRMAVIVWTGTADAVTSDVVGTWGTGNPTLATNWAYIGTPAAITIDGTRTRYAVNNLTVPTNANNIGVFIWTDASEASTDLFNVARVQLERGPVATEFVARRFIDELALVQRYLETPLDLSVAVPTTTQHVSMSVWSNTIGNGQQYGQQFFKTVKRVAPTVTVYPYTTVTNTNRISNGTGTDQAANSGVAVSITSKQFGIQNNSGGNVTTTNNLILFSWKADSRL